MIEQIKNFFITENGIEILKLVVTVGIAYTTAKYTAKNSRKNLTTQYFKEKGTEIQEKVLKFWCGLFMNGFKIKDSYQEAFDIEAENSSDTDILIKIQKESYVYCSSKTIKSIRAYQQYIYTNNNIGIEESKDLKNKNFKKNLHKQLIFLNQFVLITRIISRMKYDFTGEKVDELDLIKIKITDFNLFRRLLCRIILWYYNIKELLVRILLFLIIIYFIFIMCKNIVI